MPMELYKDDVIETFFLSLFYEGHIHTFAPCTYLSRKNIKAIRPMIYLEEKEIKSFAKRNDIPVMHKTCVVDGETKREFMKKIIKELAMYIPRLKACIFGAILLGEYIFKVQYILAFLLIATGIYVSNK